MMKELTDAANKVLHELNALSSDDSLTRRAREILLPLLENIEIGNFKYLPNHLPEKFSFFLCMREDCYCAWHLNEAGFLNAIGDLDNALVKNADIQRNGP